MGSRLVTAVFFAGIRAQKHVLPRNFYVPDLPYHSTTCPHHKSHLTCHPQLHTDAFTAPGGIDQGTVQWALQRLASAIDPQGGIYT